MVECKICRSEYKNLFGLSKHIKKIHNITSEEYYLKYIGEKKYCYNCNRETKFKSLVNGYQKYCSSQCCNNDNSKKELVSNMRINWWKNSPKVEFTKNKISNTISTLWKDKNSIYNSLEYRINLSQGLQNRWDKWRKNDFLKLCRSYGFEPSEKYKHAHFPTRFKCISCGEEFETIWNYLQSGKNCPKCFPNGYSKHEEELYEFIKSFVKCKIERNLKNIIYPLELDLYLPDKKIAVEYNGLWSHSENCEWGGKDRKYHINKTERCENLRIILIHIFEDEWLFKKEIVKSRILHILGETNSKRIFARKCVVKEIDSSTKNFFLDKFHIQGRDVSKIKLGAFYNNKLVSVMTFSKGKISKGSRPQDGVWELNRFCSDYNYSVIGIAGKLLSYFKKHYKWNKIYSYADRRWSTGDLYYKLGFKLSYITSPNYWYIKNYKRIHRFSLRKKEDEPKNISEFQLRSLQGYNWIWDCGNYKFSMINGGQ